MNKMNFRYQLNEIPPKRDLILLGLQWLVIAIPFVVIIGKAAAGQHLNDPAAQTLYLQKLFL